MRSRTMLLAAGLGSRLSPLTDERPKPLVPIGDRTLAEHVLDGLGPGLWPVVANTCHLSSVFRTMTRGWTRILELVDEPEIRGTAGGVAGARQHLGPGPILVVNSDVIAKVEFGRALAQTPADGLCLVLAPAKGERGSVGLTSDGRVARLRGEQFGIEVSSGDYVGTLAMGSRVLAELPTRGCLVADVALPLLRRGAAVMGSMLAAPDWRAPGDSLGAYWRENLAWLGARVGPAPQSFVAPGAAVARGVELVSAVIGAGARVAGSGALERVVVWPGATVSAPLENAIVTTSGRVVSVPS